MTAPSETTPSEAAPAAAQPSEQGPPMVGNVLISGGSAYQRTCILYRFAKDALNDGSDVFVADHVHGLYEYRDRLDELAGAGDGPGSVLTMLKRLLDVPVRRRNQHRLLIVENHDSSISLDPDLEADLNARIRERLDELLKTGLDRNIQIALSTSTDRTDAPAGSLTELRMSPDGQSAVHCATDGTITQVPMKWRKAEPDQAYQASESSQSADDPVDEQTESGAPRIEDILAGLGQMWTEGVEAAWRQMRERQTPETPAPAPESEDPGLTIKVQFGPMVSTLRVS